MADQVTAEQIPPAGHPSPPGDRPELPAGVSPYPRWPAWYGPVALVVGIFVTFVIASIVEAVATAGSGHLTTGSPALNDVLTVIQDGVFVATALAFAAMVRRPAPWEFGLSGARLARTVGWALLGIAVFFVIEVVYSAILSPNAKQTVTQDLGVNKSAVALIAGAVVVVIIAPVAEEVFFRGFFYRALRSRFNVWTAAAIDGVVFGAVHYTGTGVLSILPILALLGFIFCLVYERTGTLYATIGLHSLNNWLAFTAQAHHNRGAIAALGVVMLLACGFAIAKSPRIASRT